MVYIKALWQSVREVLQSLRNLCWGNEVAASEIPYCISLD